MINKQYIRSLINDLNLVNDEISHNDNTSDDINPDCIEFKELLNICDEIYNNYK